MRALADRLPPYDCSDVPPIRRYFDNAATSSPKPPAVFEAMADYARRLGGSPGRGAYYESREAGRLMHECRRRINELIGGSNPDHVVFALNCSDALNLAIKGLLLPRLVRDPRATAHVITSWLDHNSVLRPLNALIELFPGRLTQTRLRPDPRTLRLDPEDLRRAIRAHADTVLVAINHASNVTGVVQPLAELGAVCRAAGVPLLVDAAQSLGHVPVDVASMHIDLLAFPGHKGLLGPTGTGGLYIAPGFESQLAPLREGGTGSRSDLDVQPSTMPDKYEPGSQNALGLIGLSEGVKFLSEFQHAGLQGVPAIHAHERGLMHAFLDAIFPAGEPLPGLRLLGPRDLEHRIGVFTVQIEGIDQHELSAILETSFGVLTRSGIHCAPLAHRMLAQTGHDPIEPLPTSPIVGGGTRFSFGPFLTLEDVRVAADALAQIGADAHATLR